MEKKRIWKSKRTIIAWMLLTALCICGMPEARSKAAATGSCGANVVWSLSGDGKLTIMGEGAMENYTNENPAPWGTEVKSAVIGKGVSTVGQNAFALCTVLSSIQIPEGVTKIESGAFWGCSALVQIEIPDGVTGIGNYAFAGCSGLTAMELPASLLGVGYSVFSKCSSLKKIEIPDGVTRIDVCAFEDCSSLERIRIPSSVSDIGESAFKNCSTNLYIIAPPNSEAEQYAKKMGINTVVSEDQIPTEEPDVTATVVPTEIPTPTVIPTMMPSTGPVSTEKPADGTIMVVNVPSSIALNDRSQKITVKSGETSTVTYESTNKKIFSIKSDGSIRPVNCGTASILVKQTVSGVEKSQTVKVTIIPADVKGFKTKATGNGTVLIQWKKQKYKKATCEIQASTNRGFYKPGIAKPYPALKKGGYLAGKLKKGKRYYLRMRVVQKDISGKTVKGNWTAVRRVKIK